MPKLIDFKCPGCGHIEEGFDDDKEMYCWECNTAGFNSEDEIDEEFVHRMQPIFTPKNNSQRWRHRD